MNMSLDQLADLYAIGILTAGVLLLTGYTIADAWEDRKERKRKERRRQRQRQRHQDRMERLTRSLRGE